MEESWLEKFYTECGREVSLAYNVLNQTNSWGITLGTAFLATGLMTAVKVDGSSVVVIYPTRIHWYFIIFLWVIMIRFFIRSALALVNMYRWNELIYSTSKVLSVPASSPERSIFERNLQKKIDAYFYRWKSPKSKYFIVWRNLKLMYFWFFIIVLALFLWGVFSLQHDLYYYIGIVAFIVLTIVELAWFSKWDGFQYEKLSLEPEKSILQVWEHTYMEVPQDDHRPLVFAFCQEGPYKYAAELISNQTVKWIPWTYHAAEIDPVIRKALSSGMNLSNRRVLFACFDKNIKSAGNPIRCGLIDYFSFSGNVLRVTVKLEDCSAEEKQCEIKVSDPKILCTYAPDFL